MRPEVSWTLPLLRRDDHRDGLRVRRFAAGRRRHRATGNTDACGLPLNEDAYGLPLNEGGSATNVPPGVSTRRVLLVLLVLTAVCAPATGAEERVRLQCTPRAFHVVPGEPMRLELTVRADSADPIRLHVPGDPLLKLRAVEKVPVQRTREGVIVHRRVVVWQGLEPGTVKIKTLSIETKGQKLLFPEVTITVRDPGP